MNAVNLETAKITVQHVNPPKEGKQYGSIRDTDGNYWPDKFGDFETDKTYEIKYRTENGGFPNILGKKRVQPEQPLRGEFTQVSPTPRNGATLTTRAAGPQHIQEPQQPVHQQVPKASQSEHIFTCGGLYRDIEMGRVGTTEDELVDRTILWRNVYRRAFPE